MNPPISDMLVLGRQLRCPEGPLAREVADYIFASNEHMIRQTIDRLRLTSGERILEVGFGNGNHLSYLFAQGENLQYTGVELSKELISLAEERYASLIKQGKVAFLKAEGERIPKFPSETFEVFFSVNTYYFIQDLRGYFERLYPMLTRGGRLALGYIDKDFGERMTFTQEVFTFYTNEQIGQWLLEVGFSSIGITSYTEEIFSKNGRTVTRPFHIAMAIK